MGVDILVKDFLRDNLLETFARAQLKNFDKTYRIILEISTIPNPQFSAQRASEG